MEKKQGLLRLLIGLIWFSGIVLRLYRLTQLPGGMHVDEAGMAYDAWCLGTYGTDRFLNHWPVYLINYGSGQSVMYAYLAMIFMKLGGVNLWMIRMPAFLSGTVVMIFGTLLAGRCFVPEWRFFGAERGPDGESLPKGRQGTDLAGFWGMILTAVLLAVCPYFIMASRMGFDCNLMLGFSTVALYVLLGAAESGKWQRFMLFGVTAGLTLYTYSLSWIVMPLFLLFAILYLCRQGKMSWKNLFAAGIPVFILALPLLVFVAVNKTEMDTVRILWFTVPKIPYFRTDHFSPGNISENLLVLKTLLTTDRYAFNAVEPYGTLYPLSVPFVLAGIVIGIGKLILSVWKKKMDGGCLITFWFFSQILCALIMKEPDIYRMNGVYFSLAFLAASSMHMLISLAVYLAGKICAKRRRAGKGGALAAHFAGVLFMAAYLVCGASFVKYYFTQYAEDHPILWFINDYVDEILEEMKDAGPEQKIYFDNLNCSVYAYDCLIREISPYDWNVENDMHTQEENLGNRHYYLPPAEQIEDDAWYVVMDYSGYGPNLEARGFTWNTYGYFRVYYKP